MEPEIPTIDLVKEYNNKFDNYERANLDDQAIKVLINKFPENIDFNEVLLKVTAINFLYGTNLNNNEVHNMAKNILKLELEIDKHIAQDDTEIVGKIAKLKKNHYSFATKYCSWHNQDAYPIFDSIVEEMLLAYQKKDSFYSFDKEVAPEGLTTYNFFKGALALKDYKFFKNVINEFIKFYKLENFNYKKIDKFMWMYGKELLYSCNLL